MGSEDLEQSLRAEIDGYISGRMSGLQEEIARLHSQINEAFTRLSERLTSETQSDASVAVTISEHLRTARNNGIETAATGQQRARSASDVAILKAGIDDIDNQRKQGDILNSLVNRAASFAPRVAFFVVKNNHATGWRARGLEGTVGDDAVREISLPLESDTLLSTATNSRATWSGAPGTHAEDHTIFSHFGEIPPQRIVAVPLIARERAVAVLYADCAEMDSDAINLEAIETLVRVAGMAVELLATKRPAPAVGSGDLTATSAESAPSFAARPSSTVSAPDSRSRAGVATGGFDESATTPQPVSSQPASPMPAATMMTSPRAETEAEMPTLAASPGSAGEARGAERTEYALDAIASSSDSRSVATEQPPAATVASSPSSGAAGPLGSARRGVDAPLPIEVREEEKRFHNDARRFARLLVSEIKLYNEQKVREGRAEGNLYNLLHEDIDRSRQMYDKRVAPEVVGRYDYFHHELVNILAEGDSSRLGEEYTEPRQTH